MRTPYVCGVCGGSIQIGRHKSGWRHKDDSRSDHRVRPMDGAEYEQVKVSRSDSRSSVPELKNEAK
jgi:hypothetical protein